MTDPPAAMDLVVATPVFLDLTFVGLDGTVTRYFRSWFVLIDLRVPDAAGLVADLTRAAGGRRLAFAALAPSAGPAVPSGFRYALSLPATAGELEHLLWQVAGDLTARVPAPAARPDTGMIG